MDRGAWRGHKELDMTEQLTLSLSLRSKHQSRNPDKGICILPLYLWRIGSRNFPSRKYQNPQMLKSSM